MMEILLILLGLVVVLAILLKVSIRRAAKAESKADRAEAALQVINDANQAVNQQLKAEESTHDAEQDVIADRNYFS